MNLVELLTAQREVRASVLRVIASLVLTYTHLCLTNDTLLRYPVAPWLPSCLM